MTHRAGFVGRMGTQLSKKAVNVITLGMTSIPSYMVFSRASSASYIGSNGVLATAGTDVPRFDTHPVTLQPRGLLIEGASTNLIFPSDSEFTGSPQGCTISTVYINTPAGLNTKAHLVTGTNVVTYPHIYGTGLKTLVAGNNYVLSFDYRPVTSIYPVLTASNGTSNIIVKFNASGNGSIEGTVQGTPLKVGIAKTSFGFYRIFMSYTATASTSTMYACQVGFDSVGGTTMPTVNTLSAYIANQQFEVGTIPSSYIPTTTSAVTRAADYAYIPLSSLGYNFNEGTILLEYEIEGDTGSYQNLYTVSNAGGTVYAASLYMLGETTVRSTNTGSPAFDLRNQSGMRSPNTVYRHGLSYKTNDTSSSLNGGSVANSASCGLQSTMDKIVLGSAATLGVNPGNMWIRRLSYTPKKISNTNLQLLTVV